MSYQAYVQVCWFQLRTSFLLGGIFPLHFLLYWYIQSPWAENRFDLRTNIYFVTPKVMWCGKNISYILLQKFHYIILYFLNYFKNIFKNVSAHKILPDNATFIKTLSLTLCFCLYLTLLYFQCVVPGTKNTLPYPTTPPPAKGQEEPLNSYHYLYCVMWSNLWLPLTGTISKRHILCKNKLKLYYKISICI